MTDWIGSIYDGLNKQSGQRPDSSPSPGQRPGERENVAFSIGPTGQQFILLPAIGWPVGPKHCWGRLVPQGVALGWANWLPLRGDRLPLRGGGERHLFPPIKRLVFQRPHHAKMRLPADFFLSHADGAGAHRRIAAQEACPAASGALRISFTSGSMPMPCRAFTSRIITLGATS